MTTGVGAPLQGGGRAVPGSGLDRHRSIVAASLLVLATVLLRLPTLSEPRWHPDEAVYTAIAWATSHGIPLYTGVFDASPPAIYWLYRLLLWLGAGSNHLVVQLAAGGAVLLAGFLTVFLAARFLPRWAAWTAGFLVVFALSLPTLDGDILNTELAALPFFLGGLAMSLRHYDDSPPHRRDVLLDAAAGALAAIAILIRPSYGLESIVIVAIVLRSAAGRRRLPSLAAGIAAVFGATALQLALTGALTGYVGEAMPMNHRYLLMSNDGSLVPLAARLALLGVIAAYLTYRTWRTRSWWYWLWLPVAIAAATITPRELTHYVHEAIPALAIGVAALGAALLRRHRWVLAPAGALAMIVLSEGVLIVPARQAALMTGARAPAPLLHNFSYYPGLARYYGNWLALLSGRESPATYEHGFPVDVAQIETGAAILRQLAPRTPSSRLLVLGGPPDLYLRSGLLPAGPFLLINTAYFDAGNADQETVASIRSHRATVIVIGSIPGWDKVDWTTVLASSGFQLVRRTPWSIYRLNGG